MFKDQKGNSTVLILCLITVTGFIYNYVTTQNKFTTQMIVEKSQRFYVDVYMGLAESVLKNTSACSATFSGTAPSGAIPRLLTSPGTILFSSGETIGGSKGIVIESISWAPTGAAGDHEIKFSIVSAINGSQHRYLRSLNIVYNLAGGTITTCSVAKNADLASACAAFGGTLVGSSCTNIQDVESTVINGGFNSSTVAISGSASVSSAVVTSLTTGANVQATNGFTAGSLSGGTITSSGSLTAATLTSTANSICALSGCQSWGLRQCDANQFMYAIGSDGNIACANW